MHHAVIPYYLQDADPAPAYWLVVRRTPRDDAALSRHESRESAIAVAESLNRAVTTAA
ncbi:hypothetical protein [Halotalea alkalilenta]|uniref:hypothetical protein n=1 Tax=Halotalea alkalilenta TaxID=376489 RepID=UPI0012DFD54F|nr:hypothetical protein [Halotalea alkalilenta]